MPAARPAGDWLGVADALAVAGRAVVARGAVAARPGLAALVAAAGRATAPLPARRLFGTATCFVVRTGSTLGRVGATPFARVVDPMRVAAVRDVPTTWVCTRVDGRVATRAPSRRARSSA
jgi:hypothetical protein